MKEHGKAQAQKDDLFLACITSKEACQIEIGCREVGKARPCCSTKELGYEAFPVCDKLYVCLGRVETWRRADACIRGSSINASLSFSYL